MAGKDEMWLKERVDAELAKLRRRAGIPLWWLKVHGHEMQRPGVWDYLLCVRGLFAAIELKHPTDASAVLTPYQTVEGQRMGQAGALLLTEGRTVEEVRAFVEMVDARARERS